MAATHSFMDRKFNVKNAIVVAGAKFDIGTRVFGWRESGFNGYTKKRVVVKREDRRTGEVKTRVIQGPRYKTRPGGLGDISQFFVHHSGGDGRDPANMYNTLYMNRGLSVHYAVEDDGRIYQFNDALDCCYHGGSHNRVSIGVECCLFPLVKNKPDYYSAARRKRLGNLPHRKQVERIHGVKLEVFCFTDPQVDALARLAAGNWLAVQALRGDLARECNAPEFPRTTKGTIPKTVYAKHKEHIGLIGHLQCTRNKIDPAGFPWEQFEDQVHAYYWEFRVAAVTIAGG